MTTTETTLLIIVGSLLSLFIIICIAIAVFVLQLVGSAKRVATKAEEVIDSVETAATTFKKASNRASAVNIVKNIIDIGQKAAKR